MKNILIVENDLGFIFWLGGALVAADYQPWPACGVSDATELIEKAAVPIDLLIVDPFLTGRFQVNCYLAQNPSEA